LEASLSIYGFYPGATAQVKAPGTVRGNKSLESKDRDEETTFLLFWVTLVPLRPDETLASLYHSQSIRILYTWRLMQVSVPCHSF